MAKEAITMGSRHRALRLDFYIQRPESRVCCGWEVHNQVGCARYRIDLGVVDPRAPGRYLLGIECDGANYHRAKTARDRDKLREAVLRDLGWDLYRIWSTDWWADPEQETRRLVEALETTMKAPIAEKPAVAVPPLPPRPIAAAVTSATPAAVPVQPPDLPIYRPFQSPERKRAQDAFYEPISRHSVQQVLRQVVQAEGPISLGLASRRVAAQWGFERVTQKTVKHIEGLVPREEVHVHATADGTFLWSKALTPERYGTFRVPGESVDSYRNAEDLPIEEIANPALHILRPHISAPVDDIVRETSRLFGFQRVGSAVENRVRAGLRHLVTSGLVDEAEGRLTTREPAPS